MQPGLCTAPSHLHTGSSHPLGVCLGRRGRQAARSPVIGLAVSPCRQHGSALSWEAPHAGAQPACLQRGSGGEGGGELERA